MSSDYVGGSSWLGVFLTQCGVSSELVRRWEEKLVMQEGFYSPLFLMRINSQSSSYFGRSYLYKLGITALGLCEALCCLHQYLVCALDAQKSLNTNKGPINAARAAAQIVCFDTLEDSASKISWVRKFLEENNVPQDLVNLCEEQLVRQAGFGGPLTFARTSHLFFTGQYLSSVGINTLGVREALLALHADLQEEFNKRAPYHYATSNGADDAARAAVNAVLPGYLENSNTENNNSSGKKRSFAELAQQAGADVGSDSVIAPIKK